MIKWILLIVVVIVLLVIAMVYFFMKGPDLAKYEHLNDPQISKMADQKVLVVEVKGDPNVVGGKAFSALYSTYYKLQDNPKSFQLAPRVRWPLSLETPKDQWIGRYGLPVSNTAKLPENLKIDPTLKVKITTWQYGKVAEILHIGPYDKEIPTVQKLHHFIEEKGYKIAGVHEEEYLKGPSMFGKGDPAKYWTIIRYQVEEK